jgi:hypothetical protein
MDVLTWEVAKSTCVLFSRIFILSGCWLKVSQHSLDMDNMNINLM